MAPDGIPQIDHLTAAAAAAAAALALLWPAQGTWAAARHAN